ncbi:FixH family protein [Bowmanella sp. Y26]|uniref:FixH family protein n=1 Tax=Bowmanella yangjiangensis TaxID=2811230 RepID=UPI001BDDC8A2|nr:FixH family protein [Bowmanella yangjiangensis]MBT1063698.1 FixH family protein [Bowmanella yangjiangensis]
MSQTPPPWYKQFWPWFLIAIPVTSIILSTKMLMLALGGNDSMVIDDYYKEGKGINMNLDKIQHARDLGIDIRLQFSDKSVQLEFAAGKPESGAALTMYFQHPTLADKDFQLLLTQNASGVFSGALTEPMQGKWKVTLEPFDKSWRVYQDIGLPQSSPIVFRP